MVRKGLKAWWLQRASAGMISVFVTPVLFMWLTGYLAEDQDWYQFLSSPLGRTLTVVGVIGFAIHSQLGLWVVITDYVPRRFQRLMTLVINSWLSILVIWGLYLIWMIK